MSDKLSWFHICELIKIDDELERNFYEKECVVENWNVRTLRRQMDSALFLRLASSRDKEGILKLAQNGIECQNPEDIAQMNMYMAFAIEENMSDDNSLIGIILSKKIYLY